MADGFSTAAASIALLATLTQCGVEIHKAIKRIRSSRKDISKLADETIIFAGLCEDFSRTWADERRAYAGQTSSVESLNIWIKKTLKGLKKVLKTVEALQYDQRSCSSLEETLIAYLEWFFSTSLVKRLRANMAVARESVRCFSNLICIRKLNKELQMLKRVLRRPSRRREVEQELGTTIENRIDLLQQAVEIKSTVQDTSTEQLRAATEDIARHNTSRRSSDLVPEPTELLRFTASLDIFAEEILPPRRTSRRSSSSRASNHTRSSSTPRSQTSQRSHVPTRPSEINIRAGSSMSTVSTNSTQTSVSEANSVTSASAAHDDVPEPDLTHRTTDAPSHSARATIQRPDLRAREYINDPEGTILSPPKVKTHDASTPLKARVGRHLISLTATELTLNAHSLPVENYDHGLEFFQTLREYPEKLDSLDEALGQGDEDWPGIPKWVVNPSEATARAAANGVRDV